MWFIVKLDEGSVIGNVLLRIEWIFCMSMNEREMLQPNIFSMDLIGRWDGVVHRYKELREGEAHRARPLRDVFSQLKRPQVHIVDII